MGVWSLEMGVFRDRNLEFRKVFSELCAFLVLFVVKMLYSMTKVKVFSCSFQSQSQYSVILLWLLATD